MEKQDILNTFSATEGKIAIVALGNPDPDAIASAFTLGKILKSREREFGFLFENEINRPENQLLVNYLGINIEQLRLENLMDYDHVSLVDCNPNRIDLEAEEGLHAELHRKLLTVQDHHSMDEEEVKGLDPEGLYIDVRPELGACATILSEVISDNDLAYEAETATALYYALYSDTNAFLRGFKKYDFEQVVNYVERVDFEALQDIIGTVMTSETFDLINRVTDEEHIEVRGTYKFANGGILDGKSKSAIPQVADLLLREEGVEGIVIAGIDTEEKVIVGSVRYSGSRYSAEEIAEKIADGDGTGGGHVEMGGFQIQPGVVKDTLERPATQDALMDSIKERFFKVVGK
ncbi:MAG: DHH family phosphoesterase [Candidatus Bipolaricaulota bacterium]